MNKSESAGVERIITNKQKAAKLLRYKPALKEAEGRGRVGRGVSMLSRDRLWKHAHPAPPSSTQLHPLPWAQTEAPQNVIQSVKEKLPVSILVSSLYDQRVGMEETN
ncbi:unnamed protein product [Rangifer tarandus platyrhynchus]|uniref:Uncharacterized protein n=2 Tax=Rangifer tarandus platyrhynchus TaxID=3082113 RepID=A0ABN9A2Z2_RANTA|nr:unnamed protein product [Rangifer tarandus platyrhynchus]